MKKIGPNQACPCGSGKKFKKCCKSIVNTENALNCHQITLDLEQALTKRDISTAKKIIEYAKGQCKSADYKKLEIFTFILDGQNDVSEKILSKNKNFRSDTNFLMPYGTLLYETGQLMKASETFQLLLSIDKKNGLAWQNLGACSLGMFKYDEAIEQLNLALKVGNKSNGVRINLAHCYASTGLLQKAEDQLEKVTLEYKGSPSYKLAKAGLRKSIGDYQSSLPLYDELYKIFPKKHKLLFQKLDSLIELGRWSEVIDYIKSSKAENTPGVFLGLLKLYRKAATKGRVITSFIEFCDSLERNEAAAGDFLSEIAKAYIEISDVEESIRCHEKNELINKRYSVGKLLNSLYLSSDETNIFEDSKKIVNGHYKPLDIYRRGSLSKQRKLKLKIGYISGDFRSHPVADFFEPIIKFHDKNKFTIIGKTNVN